MLACGVVVGCGYVVVVIVGVGDVVVAAGVGGGVVIAVIGVLLWSMVGRLVLLLLLLLALRCIP